MARRKSYGMELPKALRSEGAIKGWAERYSPFNQSKDDWIKGILLTAFENRQYLILEELDCLDVWKNDSGRLHHLFIQNTSDEIKQRTREAYRSRRVEPLLDLDGFQLPMASSLMHFIFPHSYPIIDKLALWTLMGRKQEVGKNIPLWQTYLFKCMEIKRDYGVSLRTLDRALWQYGKEVPWWNRHAEKKMPHPLLGGAF